MITRDIISRIGLILGIILFFSILYIPIDINFPAKLVLATLLMSVFWITETIPIYATALLPLIIFPFANSEELSNTLTKYADRIIFLFLGGFILALSIEKSMLHKRFALNILKVFGTNPRHIVGAFMIATASLSAWISNTATTMLMLPIGLAIIAQINSNEKKRFAVCLLLAIAYSASLGGLAILIGTPPNAILASLAKELVNIEISFGQWLLIGVPLSVISLVITWFYLINRSKIGIKPILGEKSIVLDELRKLGDMSRDEKIVTIVFGVTALAWIIRGLVWKGYLPFMDDSIIAISAAIILFIIPSKDGRLLKWSDTKRIPWGVLILMGGGLSLASAFTATGLDAWLADQLVFLNNMHFVIAMLIIIAITIFTGEVMSNTASAALLIPIGAAISINLNIDPLLLMVPITLATTYGFIMPVGTPPNAIIFASGHISIRDMAKIGFPLDLIGIVLVTIISILLVPLIF